MLDYLQQLDTDLFLSLNGNHCPWLDQFMWYFSGKFVWVFMYASILAAIIYRYGWKRGFMILVVIGLIITLCDQCCGHWVRNSIERLRPSNLSNPISSMVHIVNGHRGGAYGFPSCHAANAFGLAVFVALLLRRRWLTVAMLAWAVVTAYSRIVLGVHYPGDLIVGAIVGTIIAVGAYYGSRYVYRRYFAVTPTRRGNFPTYIIIGVMAITVVAMAVTACFSA